jgi:soluble cytochrome b562
MFRWLCADTNRARDSLSLHSRSQSISEEDPAVAAAAASSAALAAAPAVTNVAAAAASLSPVEAEMSVMREGVNRVIGRLEDAHKFCRKPLERVGSRNRPHSIRTVAPKTPKKD